MLNNFKNILIGVLSATIVIAIGASAYNALAAPKPVSVEPVLAENIDMAGGNGNGNGGGNGNGTQNGDGTGTQLDAIPTSDLTPEEAAALLFMREEEKLARDVYTQLYALWGQPVFQNIAASEQAHMDEIKVLMDRYGLADPALGPGQFTDPNLQALYDQLMAQGSISVTDALNVGVLIEQTDIADLQARLAQTDNADLQLVFTNLMNGSYNHLAAFSGEQGNSGAQGSGGNGYHGGNESGGGGNGKRGSSTATP